MIEADSNTIWSLPFLCLYSMNFSRKPEYWELEQEFEEWE